VLEPLATLKLARAGFEPSDVIDVAVKPTGFPFSPVIVITETPEACRRKMAFRASDGWLSIEKFMDSPRVREQGYLGLNSPDRPGQTSARLAQMPRHADKWHNLHLGGKNHKI
jgi:hypothetical protein